MAEKISKTPANKYDSGEYWEERSDLLYYRCLELILRCIGSKAESIVDVGSGNSPYLEQFDWISEKVSVDIRSPYSSETVKGIVGNILDVDLGMKFDICTCLQVLEHIREPAGFARRLLTLSDVVLISVPYKWPKGSSKYHPQDPVDLEKLVKWFGREPNYSLIVQEPFIRKKGRRLFAIFNADKNRVYGYEDFKARRKWAPVQVAGNK